MFDGHGPFGHHVANFVQDHCRHRIHRMLLKIVYVSCNAFNGRESVAAVWLRTHDPQLLKPYNLSLAAALKQPLRLVLL